MDSTAATFAAEPVGSRAWVLIPSLDGGRRRQGPAKGYKPHPDGYDAQRGDPCCVTTDNAGQLWLISWEAK